jgi:hypothetical protein
LLTPADLHYERLFRLAAEMDVLPHLKRLELRGSDVREEDLLAFIQRTGVRKLSIYKVYLSSGTFRSIFNYCTSKAASMEELCFHELSETGGRVFFDGQGPCQFPPLTGPGGTDTLWRVSAEVQAADLLLFCKDYYGGISSNGGISTKTIYRVWTTQ